MNLSPEQIIALAPDAATAKAGHLLATPTKWQLRGFDENAVWAECQGSAKEPYRTQIHLTEPAFKCSCPSRKFPCKHSLGLFLLFANQPAIFEKGNAPQWVAEWLTKRSQRSERKQSAGDQSSENSQSRAANRESSKNKRVEDRAERVAAGLAELDLWLRDLMRQGLASVQAKRGQYWEQLAARLVDAQAPGCARRVREMSSITATSPNWSEVLLERLVLIYLLAESFKRLSTLPEPLQADIRTAIGWTYKEDELLSTEASLRDHWLVIGQRNYEEENLQVRRTWLVGQNTARHAALLDFAASSRPFKSTIAPGTLIDAELVFYPSNYPQRAVLKTHISSTKTFGAPAGHETIEALLNSYSEGISHNPWLEQFPAIFREVIPHRQNENWFVRDRASKIIPIDRKYTEGWKLLSISGGRPLTVFGEWEGRSFFPLSVWSEGKFVRA